MPDIAAPDDKRLKVSDVSRLYNLSIYTIYRWAREGYIPCIRQGRRGRQLRFKLSDLQKWEQENTTGKL